MGYISKNIENRRSVFWNGMIYTLGRTLSYTILGTLLIFLIHKGTDIFLYKGNQQIRRDGNSTCVIDIRPADTVWR